MAKKSQLKAWTTYSESGSKGSPKTKDIYEKISHVIRTNNDYSMKKKYFLLFMLFSEMFFFMIDK